MIGVDKLAKIMQGKLLVNSTRLPMSQVLTVASKFFNARKLSLYEYYDGLQITINNNKLVYVIGDEPSWESWEQVPNDIIRKHLHQFANLVDLEYTTRFPTETTYDFLVTAPKSLTNLTLSHFKDLSPAFIRNINHLCLEVEMEEICDRDALFLLDSRTKHNVYESVTKLSCLDGDVKEILQTMIVNEKECDISHWECDYNLILQQIQTVFPNI